MFKKDKWPFTPVRLTEIINKETLAVIEAGCCERLGRAMTIIDADQRTEEVGRIDSINLRQQFEGFCACLRDEERVRGGNDACEECDAKAAAKVCLKSTDRTSFHPIRCHMGLLDGTHAVQIRDQTVAVVFSGQYRPPEGIEQIQRNVRSLGFGHYAHIELLDEMTRPELLSLAEKLPDAPVDFGDHLKREAEHIQRIAEAEYQRLKNLWEQQFLDTLRTFSGCDETASLSQLRQCTWRLLMHIQTFCRCEYVVFFASVREGDTILAPIAAGGIPSVVEESLPHFNWKKAGLPIEQAGVKRWDIAKGPEAVMKGIRGENSDHFDHASCIPTTLGNRYRGMLVFGPFVEPVDLKHEERFLIELANIVGSFVLTELELLHLEQERRRWESTAKLLTHQLRMALTPIATQIGSARLRVQGLGKDNTTKEIVHSLKRAEELSLRLGKSARETLAGHVLLLEPEDLEFEQYPLSVLVANCVENFTSEAQRKYRQLLVDKSIELLPEAEVDVARLTIALSNLIENALKYSYPNTTISIRSAVHFLGDLELAATVIEIGDLGDAIRPEDQERIFEQGARGLTGAKLGRIPGTGLGLWEVRAVVEAHAGTVTVCSKPTSIQRRQGQAHHVTFSVKIPLRQPK